MQIQSSKQILQLLAPLAFAALIGTPSLAVAQAQAIDAVTYGQAPAAPAEYNGDLSRMPLAPTTISKPRPYRPRMPAPPSLKFMTANPQSPSAPEFSGGPRPPMPSPLQNFAGLNFNDACTGGTCGAGHPPDTNGDVGPNHYIEAVNDAIGIYSKTGTLLASFTENNLYAGTFAQTVLCDGDSFGDPVVIYDWLADRFVITWFAFNNPNSGPFYQCIAASKTSNPVTGGWWLYGLRMDPGGAGLPPIGDLNDYGKFGLWHDCLYMGANEFAGNNYDGVMFASFSRADMYSGSPLTFALGWIPPVPANAFTLVPSNNQGTGANAAQPGTPNYFVSESGSGFFFEVRKFTAGANCGGGGTLSAPTNVSQASYLFRQGAIVPQPNTAIKLDMIDDRIMQKVQYRKIGSAESLWVTHPIGTGTNKKPGVVGMQWAQLDVSGGTIAPTPVQQQNYSPDSTVYRFMGSLAVDIQGNMALGYSTSSGTAPNFPSIRYAGRLATDPLGTMPQTEVTMTAGAGSQTNSCGGPCDRWGDYSAMSLDPADSCTFWYTTQYYSSQVNGNSGNWQTQIGSFKFPGCSLLPPTTTTPLVSSLNPSNVGDSVTFTATVNGAAPTGSVNFTDGGTSICATAPFTGGTANSPTAQCGTSSLTAGTHSIVATYSGDSGNAGSASSILSQVVNGVAPSSLVNASFEVPALSSGFQYAPTGAGVGWTFSGNSGVERNGSAFGAAPAPNGVQAAFIQTTGSISQALNLNAGNYTLSFQAAKRSCCVSPFVQPIKVTVDGTQIGSLVSPPSTSFGAINIPFSVASTGAHTFAFTGTDPTDKTTFIDNVTVTGPPAPGTTLASSVNPAKVNQGVTFTATVTGTNPTGNVAFSSNSSPIAGCTAVALSGSGNTRTAQCPTSFSAAATYSIVANYGGDGSNSPSASSPLSEVVKSGK